VGLYPDHFFPALRFRGALFHLALEKGKTREKEKPQRARRFTQRAQRVAIMKTEGVEILKKFPKTIRDAPFGINPD
jgi:hypothetical protein